MTLLQLKKSVEGKVDAVCSVAHLHAIHGLSDLVQVVGRAERLQADVSQLQLLFSQLVLQLEDDLGLGLGALAQPAAGITHREAGGRVEFEGRGRVAVGRHLDGYGSTEVSRGERSEFRTAKPPLPLFPRGAPKPFSHGMSKVLAFQYSPTGQHTV